MPLGEPDPRVPPQHREEWHRDGALAAMQRAIASHSAVRVLDNAAQIPQEGMAAEKQQQRAMMLKLAQQFHGLETEKQMLDALSELKLWAEERANRLQGVEDRPQ